MKKKTPTTNLATNWTVILSAISIIVSIIATFGVTLLGLYSEINSTKILIHQQTSEIKELIHDRHNDTRDRIEDHVESLHPRPLTLPRAEKHENKS